MSAEKKGKSKKAKVSIIRITVRDRRLCGESESGYFTAEAPRSRRTKKVERKVESGQSHFSCMVETRRKGLRPYFGLNPKRRAAALRILREL